MMKKHIALFWFVLGCLTGQASETNQLVLSNDRLFTFVPNAEVSHGIQLLTQQLQTEPTNITTIYNLALAYRLQGDFEKSLMLWNDYIRLNPTNDMAFKCRATIYSHFGQYAAAIKDFDEGLRLNPQDAYALANRGYVYSRQGEYEKALHDFNEAVRVDANNDEACNNLAWLRATCPVAALRSGAEAVQFATKASELSHWARWTRIDTLAAAYAEAGDFTKAVEYEKQALAKGACSEDLTELGQRLALFENHQPYRDKTNH